jgi:hypothetical protein
MIPGAGIGAALGRELAGRKLSAGPAPHAQAHPRGDRQHQQCPGVSLWGGAPGLRCDIGVSALKWPDAATSQSALGQQNEPPDACGYQHQDNKGLQSQGWAQHFCKYSGAAEVRCLASCGPSNVYSRFGQGLSAPRFCLSALVDEEQALCCCGGRPDTGLCLAKCGAVPGEPHATQAR